jgi:hypothetical protein
MKCIKCGSENSEGAKFCLKCGAPIPEEPKPAPAQNTAAGAVYCPQCGTANARGDTFCQKCGARLDAQSGFTQPTAVPPAKPPRPPRKPREPGAGGKWKLPVIIIAVVLVLAAAAAAIVFTRPKVVVGIAMKKFAEDKVLSDVDKVIGAEDMAKAAKSKGSNVKTDIKLDSFSGESSLSGIGISADYSTAPNGSVNGGTLTLSYNDMLSLDAEVYADQSQLFFSLPDIMDTAYSVDIPGEDEGYKQVMEDYENSQILTKLVNQVKFDKAQKQGIMVDGKMQNCRGYMITIPASALSDFVGDTADFLKNDDAFQSQLKAFMVAYSGSESISGYGTVDDFNSQIDSAAEELQSYIEDMDDVQAYLYVDGKGRLAGLDYKYEDDGSTFDMSLRINGGAFHLENFSLTVDDGYYETTFYREGSSNSDGTNSKFGLKSDGDEAYITYSLDSTGSYDVEVSIPYEMDVKVSGSGDLKKGSSFSTDDISMTVSDDYGDSASLSGSYSFSIGSGDIPEKPGGDVVDLSSATPEELYEVGYNIGQALGNKFGEMLY